MFFRILDADAQVAELTPVQGAKLLSQMVGDLDPRVSGCLYCRSCVVATEPFSDLIDARSVELASESEMVQEINNLIENTTSVHLYIWEENDCIHTLWRDPLAEEWSEVTGEERLR